MEVKREQGCGFAAPDMYTEFTQSEQPKSAWVWCGGKESVVALPADGVNEYVICCSLDSPATEDRDTLVTNLLTVVQAHSARGKSGEIEGRGHKSLSAVRVELVTVCPNFPLLPLKGLFLSHWTRNTVIL
jgi:hypothetical protein